MKDDIKILLDRALLGQAAAWKEYQNTILIQLPSSPLNPFLDSIVEDSREFIAYILQQQTLSMCPTIMLEGLIETLRNIIVSEEQKQQLINLVRASLLQPGANKLGLSLLSVFCHFFLKPHLSHQELGQMLILNADDKGVAHLIKAIIAANTDKGDALTNLHYQLAIEAGNVMAMNIKAGMHRNGWVQDNRSQVEHNAQAVALYKLSWQKGRYITALANLAWMYKQGRVQDKQSSTKHDANAVSLLNRAICAGNATAMFDLAGMLAEGRVLDRRSQAEHDIDAVALYRCALTCGITKAEAPLLELQEKIGAQSHQQQHETTTENNSTSSTGNNNEGPPIEEQEKIVVQTNKRRHEASIENYSTSSNGNNNVAATNSTAANFPSSESFETNKRQRSESSGATVPSFTGVSISKTMDNKLKQEIHLQNKTLLILSQAANRRRTLLTTNQPQIFQQPAQTTSSKTDVNSETVDEAAPPPYSPR